MRRQFEIFENPSPRSRTVAPYVVAMQSHFMDEMPTVLVAPLVRERRGGDFTRVSVLVQVAGESFYLSLAELAPILRDSLRQRVGDVRAREDEIRRALDRLFTGF